MQKMNQKHQTNQKNNKLVIGTHLIDWRPTDLVEIVNNLYDVVKRTDINKNETKFLFLIQSTAEKSTTDRIRESKEWHKYARNLLNKPKLIYDFEYIPYSTVTLAWNTLQFHAFNTLHASSFCYYDPHLLFNLPHIVNKDKIINGLADFLFMSQSCDYLIGDYTPTIDPIALDKELNKLAVERKINIEKNVKQKLVNKFSLVLDIRNWELFENLERPRSEFYSLSKALFNTFQNRKKIVYDFGLQMLVFAKFHKLDIQRVYIGKVQETGSYDLAKVEEQLRRVDFQLSQLQSWLSAN
jgi:hypothetical protein